MKNFKVKLECPNQFYFVCADGIGRYLPCGKCSVCKSKMQNDWFVRLKNEFDHCSSAWFITLTYNDENLPLDDNGVPVVNGYDVQKFFKRLRKNIQPFKVRYFLCSEYCPSSMRPHYHFILFNFPDSLDIDRVIGDVWKLGFYTIAPVNDNRLRYVAKYCTTIHDLPEYYQYRSRRPFIRCSRRPSIGGSYLENSEVLSYHHKTQDFTVMIDGFKYSMPRYYRRKIFSDEERKAFEFECNKIRSEYVREYIERFGIHPNSKYLIKDYGKERFLSFSPSFERFMEFDKKVKRKNKKRVIKS